MLNFKQKLNKISTIIFDVEGVLTSEKILLSENGELLSSMHSKDIYALRQAMAKGIRIVALSEENNPTIKNVLSKLEIKDIFFDRSDKSAFFSKYIIEGDIKVENVLFMGDDIPDLEMLTKVGLPVCPDDAATQVKEICQYVSPHKGGEGCVRDIIEQVLRVQNKWEIIKR